MSRTVIFEPKVCSVCVENKEVGFVSQHHSYSGDVLFVVTEPRNHDRDLPCSHSFTVEDMEAITNQMKEIQARANQP